MLNYLWGRNLYNRAKLRGVIAGQAVDQHQGTLSIKACT